MSSKKTKKKFYSCTNTIASPVDYTKFLLRYFMNNKRKTHLFCLYYAVGVAFGKFTSFSTATCVQKLSMFLVKADAFALSPKRMFTVKALRRELDIGSLKHSSHISTK